MSTHRGTAPSPDTGRRQEPPSALDVRVECARRTAGEILAEIETTLRHASERREEAAIVLVEVGLIADSVCTFLKGLARLLPRHSGLVMLSDPSGYANAFLDLWDDVPRRRDRGSYDNLSA